MSNRYTILKCNGGWAIAVDDAIVLVCKRKAIAHQIVRDVTAGSKTAAVADTNCGAHPRADKRNSGKPLTQSAT